MERKKVLIIDDDQRMCELVKEMFKETFECDYELTCQNVLTRIEQVNYSLIILDIGLGDEDGLAFYPQLQAAFKGPIIFLSGQSNIETRIQGLELGADDFIVKPFHLKELLYKVMRIVERHEAHSTYTIGEYEVDEVNNQISYRGQDLNLTLLPYNLLLFLLKNANTDLRREDIFKQVWKYDDDYTARLVDSNISLLRKLTNDPNIKSVRGVGYRYEIN